MQRRLSAPRWRHVAGVRQTARLLAERWQVDPERADLAALFHDYAKEVKNEELLRLAGEHGLDVDPVERALPHLLHGPVAAASVRAEFGVSDPVVLEAIRLHTTGDAQMGPVAQVVYLADYIEPGRDFPEVDQLRQLAQTDLRRALLAAFDHSIAYVLSRGWLLHPRSVAARNWLLGGGR